MKRNCSTKSGRAFALVLAAGASAAVLGGCGATTESIVDKMFDEKIESSANEMTYDLGVKLNSEGMSMEFGVNGDGEYEFAKDGDDTTLHMIMDAKLTVPEMFASFLDDTSVSAEIYGESTEDESTIYLSTDDGDTWSMTTQEVEESLDEETQEELINAYKKVLSEAELQKKLEDVDGEKCYVLKLNTTGDKFSEVYDIVFDAVNEESDESIDDMLEEADMSRDDLYDLMEYVKLDITMYASKKTGQCVRCDVDASETDLGALVSEAFEMSGTDIDDMPFDPADFEFTAFSFSMTSKDINNTEVEIPDDVKDEAEESGFGGVDIGGDVPMPDTPDEPEEPDEPADPDVPVIDEPADPDDLSSYNGLNSDGSYTFPYNDSNDFITVLPYGDYAVDESMSDGYSAYFYDDDSNFYYVQDYCDYAIEQFILTGSDDISDSYENFVCDYDTVDGLSVNGQPVYVVDASYTYVWSDGDKTDSTYKAILIPYHDDDWDEDTFLQISLDSFEDSENLTLEDMAAIANAIIG
ncbi:MAG: hypothetical protein K6C99_08985 [Lachnospiraceae bacterium]|nr:hypothetical protein [Lachnospiraceae bacterium]